MKVNLFADKITGQRDDILHRIFIHNNLTIKINNNQKSIGRYRGRNTHNAADLTEKLSLGGLEVFMFNEENWTTMLWVVRYECPIWAQLSFICYFQWSILVIRDGTRGQVTFDTAKRRHERNQLGDDIVRPRSYLSHQQNKIISSQDYATFVL